MGKSSKPSWRPARQLLGFLFALTLPACEGAADEPNEERGELGKGTFRYECFGVTDVACGDGAPTFPSGIAVGGRFELDYEPRGGISPNVIPASSDSVEELPGGFRMVRPGYAALFAVDGNRNVQDLIHLRGARVGEVRVSASGGLPVARLTLSVDEELEVSAVPMDEFDVVLAGALDYEWRSDDATVVTVETLEQVDRIHVRGVGEGEASLLVKVGEVEYTLPVVVSGDAGAPSEPEPMPDGDADAPEPEPHDADAGTVEDAGTEAPLPEETSRDAATARDAGADPAVADAGFAPNDAAVATDGGAQ